MGDVINGWKVLRVHPDGSYFAQHAWATRHNGATLTSGRLIPVRKTFKPSVESSNAPVLKPVIHAEHPNDLNELEALPHTSIAAKDLKPGHLILDPELHTPIHSIDHRMHRGISKNDINRKYSTFNHEKKRYDELYIHPNAQVSVHAEHTKTQTHPDRPTIPKMSPASKLIADYNQAIGSHRGRYTNTSPRQKLIDKLVGQLSALADKGDPEALRWYDETK